LLEFKKLVKRGLEDIRGVGRILSQLQGVWDREAERRKDFLGLEFMNFLCKISHFSSEYGAFYHIICLYILDDFVNS